MSQQNQHLEEVLQFLRGHRSNEANFNAILAKLNEEMDTAAPDGAYARDLQAVKEKQLPAYTEARENGGTAWPEFENLVAQFERSITAALKE